MHKRYRLLSPFYTSDNGGGQGAGGNGQGTNTGQQQGQNTQGGGSGGQEQGGNRQSDADRITAGFQRLLDRHGDGLSMVLYRDNYELRERVRRLQEQVAPEGGVTLNKEQAQTWASYQQLGAPADLKTAVEARTTAETKLAQLERDGQLRDVAAAAGYRFSVLRDRDVAAGGLTYTITEKDGAKVVTVKDKEGKEHSLADYAKAQWGDYLPALQERSAGESTGTTYVRQAPAGSGERGSTDPVAERLKRRYTPRTS
jgi:hypothetical protein